jgi:hypothetical protein
MLTNATAADEPDAEVLNAVVEDDLMQPGEWSLYRSVLVEQYYDGDLEQITDLTYGEPFEQTFMSYPESFVDECVQDADAGEQHRHVMVGHGEDRNTIGLRHARDYFLGNKRTAQKIDWIRWLANNPTKVDVGSGDYPSTQTATLYEQLYEAVSGGTAPDGGSYQGCAEAWGEKQAECYGLVEDAKNNPLAYPGNTFRDDAAVVCAPPVIEVEFEVLSGGATVTFQRDVLCTSDGIESAVDELPHAEVFPEPVPPPSTDVITIDQSSAGASVSAATHMCAFAGVRGSFEGTGQEAFLSHIATSTPTWSLLLSNTNSDVAKRITTSMACAELASFDDEVSTSSSPPALLADYSLGSVTAPSGVWEIDDAPPLLAFEDKTLLTVAGMSGNFAGGGEFVKGQNRLTTTNRRWEFGADDDKTVEGGLLEVGVAEPYNDERQYVAISMPDGTERIKLLSNTATSDAVWASGPREVKLIPEDKGMCFLTKVAGAFDGHGESIKMSKKDGFWHLRLDAACRDTGSILATNDCVLYKTIEANVSCLAYDQSIEGDLP